VVHRPPYPDAGDNTGGRPGRGSTRRLPRWVKVLGISIGILVLLFVVLRLAGVGGQHGPGRHTSSGGPGDVPLSSVVGNQMPSADPTDQAPPEGGRG
jgi:hypothetical protein